MKFIQKYGVERKDNIENIQGFTSLHYKKVIDFVSENFAKNISLERMAGVACLSPYHFSRLFKQTLGQSPHQYVLHYRIEQASNMLLDKSRSIMDVAISCGFSDQAHYSRVFKKITQTTPKQFRLLN